MAEELTIAIIALIEGAPLAACIEAAHGQANQLLVVARDGTVRDGAGVEVGRSEGSDVPARRRRAAELAQTPLIGFLEDTVVIAPGWTEAASAALARDGVGGVGGPVAINPRLPSASRALALTEYGRFSATATGTVEALPGCNFAFRRKTLLAALPAEGLIDNEVFDRLAAAGKWLAWAPGMAVTYSAAHADGARLTTRFGHGRLYAGRRLAKAGLGAKLAGAAKALVLPAVLFARTLREAGAAELRSPATLAQAALQHGAWAAGEFAGALFGPPPGGTAAWQ